jgi:hypothetical protein
MEVKTNLNPFSKVETLDLKNISDQDYTVIYHIKIRDLPLYDIFIDDHNHYWSISKELIMQKVNLNPLTNSPFDENEWKRIQSAIMWYYEVIIGEEKELERYKRAQIVPIPMPAPNPLSMNDSQTNTANNQDGNNHNENNQIEQFRNRKNCYITPLHGCVGNNCYCFPFFSYNGNLKKIDFCYGSEDILCNNQIINYSWNNPLCITLNNNNEEFNYCPLLCCGYQNMCSCAIFPEHYFCPLLCSFKCDKLWLFKNTFFEDKSYCCCFGLLLSDNCNNGLYTPVFCCFEGGFLSPILCCAKQCLISPLFCLNEKYCCLLGIPVYNRK